MVVCLVTMIHLHCILAQGEEALVFSSTVGVLAGLQSVYRSTMVPFFTDQASMQSTGAKSLAGEPFHLLISPQDSHGNIAHSLNASLLSVDVLGPPGPATPPQLIQVGPECR